MASASIDGTVKVWDIKTGNHFTLVSPDDSEEWIMFTADGYFDASKRGGELVAMVSGTSVYGVDQFAVKNNRPDIILERLGMGSEGLIAHYYHGYAKRLKRLGLSEARLSRDLEIPTTEIIEKRQNGKALEVKFKLNGALHKLMRYNVHVNDVPLFGAEGRRVTGNTATITETIELTNDRNKIEISCLNEGGAESIRALAYADFKQVQKPNLYFLGFGASEYRDKKLNLKYAHRDAEELGRLFSKMQGKYDNVYVRTYLNQDVTLENIKGARAFLSNSRVDDTFVLFLSGHGLHADDAEATYYYLTHEADVHDLPRTAADFELIERLVSDVRPRNKLLLLDTCESGEVDFEDRVQVLALADSKGLRARAPLDVVRSSETASAPKTIRFLRDRYIYNDLLRKSGAIVFSSSKGDELSYETDAVGNGLFAHAIMRSLSARETDRNRDGYVSTDELRDSVAQRVSTMSHELQHPTIDRDNLYQKFGFPLVTGD